jgi:hypothetical protein
LNNNAPIGTLTLDAQSANTNTRINIGSAFNGNVQRLDLRGNIASVLTVPTWWEGRTVFLCPVIFGYQRFVLGEFVSSNYGRQGIAPQFSINASGVLE